MPTKQKPRKFTGILLGLVAAGVTFVSSGLNVFAYDSPLYIVMITLPFGLVAILFGSWRTGLVGLYCAAVAIIAYRTSWTRLSEAPMVYLIPLGIVVAIGLFLQYRWSQAMPKTLKD